MNISVKPPKVAVIIINYNGYGLTRDCMHSFRDVIYDSYVLIIVDNASSDNSTSRLRAEFPNVVYVQSDSNKGFAGGNNLGLQKAYELGANYVFFLNNDTTVSENIFDLVDFLEQNQDVGMVAPLTFYHSSPEVVSFAGGRLNRNTGIISFYNKGLHKECILDEIVYCSFLEGAAILARSEIVQQVGGFNEDYFLNSEEAELCVKVADTGYRLALIARCFVWHKVSQSMGAGSELINYYVYRNRLYFIKNNAINFRFTHFFAIINNYTRTFFSLLILRQNTKAARGLLLGVFDFIRGVKGVGRYRRQLQSDLQVDEKR